MTAPLHPTPKGTILYIEDNPQNAMLVQRILGAEDYKVIIAEDGLSGIDMAKSTKPDLILMDINLPDLSGREVTTRLRALDDFKLIPIVALTAQTDERQRAMTIAAGVDGYITKPFDLEELAQRVAFHLKGGKEVFSGVDVGQAQQLYNQEVVTHLERKLREVQKTNEELRRLDKMKDDFLQRVAHELRTPLTILYGYGRLIQSAEPIKLIRRDEPQFAAYVDGLVESIERMHGIVNEILTIYRIATGGIQINIGLVNIRNLVLSVTDSYAQAFSQRDITLHFDKQEWPSSIQADGDLLKMAISNLIGNAIKYTPDGGHVRLSAKTTDTTLKLSVQDSGIGISEEDQARIFERFYSVADTELHSTSKTSFQGGGLGLGLSITKGIVDAHDGKIWVESMGQDTQKLPGSTFHIELPLRKDHRLITDPRESSSTGNQPAKA